MTGPLNRISSVNTYDNALRNLSDRQVALARLQENLTSGKKMVRLSDDPTGAAQSERALTRIARIQVEQRALEAQRATIAEAESTLGDVSNALQEFRELIVGAGNGAYGPSDRVSILNQLQGLRDQIFALANRTDSNGRPLFSGLGSETAPFIGPQSSAPDYTFNGLPGQAASTDNSIPFVLDGESTFMHKAPRDGVYNVTTSTIAGLRSFQTGNVSMTAPTLVTGLPYQIVITNVDSTSTPGTTTVSYDVIEDPNGAATPIASASASYASAQPGSVTVTEMPGLSLTLKGTPQAGDTIDVDPSVSLFSVLDDAISDIKNGVNNNAINQAVGQALGNIDIGMGRISAARGQAGNLLTRAERISEHQGKQSVQLEENRSRAEDLDMVKGISDFQNQQTGYQAALQSYAQMQRLSLFNFIS